LHDSVRHTGHRIPNHVVGEWKLIARLPMILVLLRPASRLREAKIGIGLARARNDREHAVEHFVAARVVIESAPKKVARETSRLRDAFHHATSKFEFPPP